MRGEGRYRSGPYMQRAPDVDTPPQGRRRLHAFCSENVPALFRTPSYVSACKNACASSLTHTLDVFPLRAFVLSFSEDAHASRICISRCILLRRRNTLCRLDLPRIPGPQKLACPRPARAAWGNVGGDLRLSSRVTSPIFDNLFPRAFPRIAPRRAGRSHWIIPAETRPTC